MKGKSIEKSLITLALLFLFILPAKAQAPVSNNNNIHFITDTVTSFDSLISKFKGKVIYVDVWATWCYPCMTELQQADDISGFSDFAVKNNIVILYICCDRDDRSWKSFINQNNLAGYHVLVNDKLNKDLHERFSYGQTGKEPGLTYLKKDLYIPRHMIIDKIGVITDSLTGKQGSDAVYIRLNNILKDRHK